MHPNQFIVLTVLLVVTGLTACSNDTQNDSELVTGFPWQIERLPNGTTRVFGIVPGQTTLDVAIAQLGDDNELAIIAAPGETGSLEVYYSHYAAGLIEGKLILVADIEPDTLASMQMRARRKGGTHRLLMDEGDLPTARRAAVRAITFMPTFDLDEEITRARFGIPAEVLPVSAQEQHLLYPELGLDLVLNADGKDVLQYLSPDDFDTHRAQLQVKEN
jgi:hypothetical protein